MSEDTTQQEAAPVAETEASADGTKTFDESYVKKLREEAASYRVKLKEAEDSNTATAQRVEAVEAEKQSLAEQIAAFEKEKEHMGLVAEIANASGVPSDVLRGSNREELEAHAEVLKSLLKPTGPVVPGQEKHPSSVGADPLQEFARGLFEKARNE